MSESQKLRFGFQKKAFIRTALNASCNKKKSLVPGQTQAPPMTDISSDAIPEGGPSKGADTLVQDETPDRFSTSP